MAIITLTTDFGHADHFVAAMKGVIHSIAPRASIVDITHEITPYEIVEGAFVISEAFSWFPKKTVHIVVVDPGVGTDRRPILVETAGHLFLGPDNGVLSMVYAKHTAKVRHITNQKLMLRNVSSTFHGRDIFAPVAAHLAKGAGPASVGPRIEDYLRTRLAEPQRTGKRTWAGVILKVDRFGNLITNLHVSNFDNLPMRTVMLTAGLRTIEKLVSNFAEGGPGEPVAIVGSSGYIEVAVNQGSAAKTLGCGAGAPVEISIY